MKKQIIFLVLFGSWFSIYGQGWSYTKPSEIGVINDEKINGGFLICPDRLNDGNKWKIRPCEHSIRFSGNRISVKGFNGVTYFEIDKVEYKPSIIIFDVINITNYSTEQGHSGVVNVILNKLGFPIQIEIISNRYGTGYFYLLVEEEIKEPSQHIGLGSINPNMLGEFTGREKCSLGINKNQWSNQYLITTFKSDNGLLMKGIYFQASQIINFEITGSSLIIPEQTIGDTSFVIRGEGDIVDNKLLLNFDVDVFVSLDPKENVTNKCTAEFVKK